MHSLGASPVALLVLFAIATAILLWRAREHLAIVLFAAFAWAQFTIYAWVDLPPYHWYYAPALSAATLAVAVAFRTSWRSQQPLPMLAGIAAATWFLAAAMPDLVAARQTREHYRQAGEWFARNTPPGASIAANDIGIVGFHAWPRTIVDMQGLATPGGVDAITSGDTGWWFDRHRPDYVLVHAPALATFEVPAMARTEFRSSYRRVEGVRIPGLEIFARVDTAR
jgi:hypothetical protein